MALLAARMLRVDGMALEEYLADVVFRDARVVTITPPARADRGVRPRPRGLRAGPARPGRRCGGFLRIPRPGSHLRSSFPPSSASALFPVWSPTPSGPDDETGVIVQWRLPRERIPGGCCP